MTSTRTVLTAAVLATPGLVACTSDREDEGPAPLSGDLVVEDAPGDVEDGSFGPGPGGGVADITRFVVDQRGGTVVVAVQLASLPAPDDVLRQSMTLAGEVPGRTQKVLFSTNRTRRKPVRASVSVRDDASETITYPCGDGVRARWSYPDRTVALEVPRSCLPRGGLVLDDPEASFGARDDDGDSVDGVDLPDRLVVPVP